MLHTGVLSKKTFTIFFSWVYLHICCVNTNAMGGNTISNLGNTTKKDFNSPQSATATQKVTLQQHVFISSCSLKVDLSFCSSWSSEWPKKVSYRPWNHNASPIRRRRGSKLKIHVFWVKEWMNEASLLCNTELCSARHWVTACLASEFSSRHLAGVRLWRNVWVGVCARMCYSVFGFQHDRISRKTRAAESRRDKKNKKTNGEKGMLESKRERKMPKPKREKQTLTGRMWHRESVM